MNRRTLTGYSAREGGQMGTPIPWIVATDAEARDGLVIPTSAWKLDAYRKNPVVLLNHRYDSLPIGKALNVRVTDHALLADIVFDSDPESAAVEAKVRRGFLNSASVGWAADRTRGNVVEACTLLDISVVSIPSDVNAVKMARSFYQRSINPARSRPMTNAETMTFLESLHEHCLVQSVAERVARDLVRDRLREMAGAR